MALRTVGVRLTADVSAYMSNLKRAGAATKDFGGQLDKSAKAGNLDAVADRAGVAGIALVGMAAYAVKAAADFDRAMSGVKAATHASTADMEALRKAALQAGKDTSYSATEAAKGITELSKAGVSTADVLGGGLKGALSLAAAGQLDVGEAAETAASAMTQFKLSGKDIPHIADLLAAGAGKAQGSVHDMGMALNQSGLVASQFGLSIEDSTGTLAAFASAGLTGSDAGTSFKQMLLMLANPAEKTQNLMEDLGIAAYDASGKFVGITNLAEQLKTKLSGLTQAQRDAALAQIFGSDAIRSANVLYQQGGKGIQDWINKVNDSGYASKTAADLTDNLAGDIERLKGSLETLAIESGSGASGGLRQLVKGLEAMVDQFSRMPSAVSSSTVVIAGIIGLAGLALAAFIKLRSGLAAAVAELNRMGPAGEKAATGLQKAAGAAGKAVIAFAALEVASSVLNSFGDGAANADRLAESLTNLANTGRVTGEMADKFGTDLQGLGDDAAVANSGVTKWLDKIAGGIPVIGDLGRSVVHLSATLAGKNDYQTALQNFASLDTALTDYMTTTNDARKASEMWNKVASEAGIPIERLIELLPNAYKKVGELNTAADKGTGAMKGQAEATGAAVKAQEEYKTAADAAAAAARGERDALSQLSDFMKAQSDPAFRLIDAQDKLAKAQKDAAQATKEHGKNSVEAKAATRDLARAAIDLQGSVGALGGSFDGKLSPALRATLKAANLTEAQISDVEKQFKTAKKSAEAYDGKYEAQVSIKGDGPVNKALDDLLIKQRALATGLSYTSAKAAIQKDLDRNRQRKAAGGHIHGPGTETSDSVPAMLSDGEFVVRAASVRKIESRSPGTLAEMNATGQLPGYAGGGKVMRFPTNVAKTDIPSWSEVASKVGGNFGDWPSSPSAQRGDSGVWRKILALVKASGIPYEFGNSYRPGDPKWHGSGRAIDFMGYNQDRLAQFFMSRQNQVLELIHRTKNRDYGITRGHYNAMPTQWPLHRNHLHIAMKNGGTITEPITGVGASGRTYSFGENYQPERVTPNWQPAGGGGGNSTMVNVTVHAAVGTHPREIGRQVVSAIGSYLQGGGELRVNGQKVL